MFATFAGGCFWGMERLFREEFGKKLKSVAVGYIGGDSSRRNVVYEDVCTGTTGFAEAIQICFDPSTVEYKDLLKFFFRVHDPSTLNRQGVDTGTQYRSAIFAHSPDQLRDAQDILGLANQLMWSSKVVTELQHVPADNFIVAEEYHQNYLGKNPDTVCPHRIVKPPFESYTGGGAPERFACAK